MRSLLHALARLDAGDWIALGALAVSVVVAWRQWRFERRQARLIDLQIEKHEAEAGKRRAKGRAMEQSQIFADSFENEPKRGA